VLICTESIQAALLFSIGEGESWRENLQVEKLTEYLRFANAAGALTAQKQGAIPALPNLDQVKQFIDQADN
jgi:sugar/nucleoside kinase (ribokinase family)